MFKKLKTIQFLLFQLIFSGIFAQEEVGFFRNYNVEQGLPSAYVLSVTQDNQGFIWIATNNGLSKFDGYVFSNYSKKEKDSTSLSGDFILCTEPTNKNQLWVGHYESGLDLFDTHTGKVIRRYNEKNGLPDNRVNALWLEEKKNRLWVFSSKNYFIWIDLETGQIIQPKIKGSPENKTALPITNSLYDVKEEDGVYWLATNDGLGLYKEETGELRMYLSENQKSGYTNSNRLRKLYLDNEFVWTVSRGGNGLQRFHKATKTWQYFNVTKDESTLILDIQKVNENTFWLATVSRGLITFNTQTFQKKAFPVKANIPSSLNSDVIHHIFIDNQKNIWVSTQNGLSLYSPSNQLFKRIEIEQKETGPFKKTPLTFLDDQNNLYVGLSNAEGLLVYHKDNNSQRFLRPPGLKPKEKVSILRMRKQPDGGIWFTTQEKLFEYLPKENRIIDRTFWTDKWKDIRIHSIFFIDKDRVLCGTRFDGLLLYDISTKNIRQLTAENAGIVHNRFIAEIEEDDLGRIWIGTERGISVLDKRTLKVLKNFDQNAGYKVIYRIAKDTEGYIWTSSESQGAFKFDPKTLERIAIKNKASGLPSSSIQHVATDPHGFVWITTQQGLCIYDSKTENVQLFNTANGLIENHLEGSLNSLSDGKIALGFEESFCVFDPKVFIPTKTKTKPRITSLEIFKTIKPIPKDSMISLEADENFFTLHFSALRYDLPEKIKYQYMLEGIDKEWVNPGRNNQANYTNIKSGEYIFLVRSKLLRSEDWSTPTSLRIYIKPKFYETYWFYGLILLTVLAVIQAFYRLKISQIRNEENIKRSISNELNSLEMRALRSQMNPHFIFNSLNSIKYFILNNDITNASKYLNKFSGLIRRIFNNTQQEFVNLEEEIETIGLFLEIEKMRFGDKLSYEIVIDEKLEPAFMKIPNMLVQPHVENAVWHGIMHKNGKGLIRLEFSQLGEEQLKIIIEDDGIGRKASGTFKSKSATMHKSKGLELTKKRIELLNSIHNLQIRSEIHDLINSINEPSGTRIELIMRILYED